VSSRQRLTFALLAVVIAVVAVVAIAASGGSDDPEKPATDSSKQTSTTDATPVPSATRQAEATKPPEAQIPKVVVKGGEPAGGIKEIEAKQGDRVRFVVVSDVADEVHLHGYDIGKDVSAGGQVTFSFKADITGIFEAELEERGTQIVSLRVDPK